MFTEPTAPAPTANTSTGWQSIFLRADLDGMYDRIRSYAVIVAQGGEITGRPLLLSINPKPLL